MKTSPGLLLGVLFTLVVVIVAVVIYFNTRPGEEKPGTSTGPSSTLPSIGNLTIAQTLSPNSDSETYTIEPYTIEYSTPEETATGPATVAAVYEEGDTEKRLSRNVRFKLTWTNQANFETVSKIQVEHYIRGIGTTTTSSGLGSTFVLTPLQIVEVPTPSSGIWNYAYIEVNVTGLPDDNEKRYSFVGDNMFKIVATYDGTNQLSLLYDGTADLEEGATHPSELVIKREDLTATIVMTESRTVTFDVSLLEDTRRTSKDIQNTSYTFTATTLDNRDTSIRGIELISQDSGGKNFKFKIRGSEEKYLGVNKDATGALTLITDASKDSAAIITFAKSITKGDDFVDEAGIMQRYRMLKTVVVENNVNVDYYLFGPHIENDTTIKWLTLFGRTSPAGERVMKDWKVTEE
jgi:hypothetical protein